MNSSANLISLSDSGLSSSSSSLITFSSGSGAAGTTITNNGGNNRSLLINISNNKSDLLIDFTDEEQVPASQGIMTLAEIDDTFGLFNKAPTSHPRVKQIVENDEASKLVRSFTSGRKSGGDGTDNPVLEIEKDNSTLDEQKNESIGSTSEFEQPTMVEAEEEEEGLSPATPEKCEEEGISEQPMVATLSCNSGGSESDILDISNLSSFSIPEADFDDNEFLEEIKAPSSSKFMEEIRYQIMQEKNEFQEPYLLSEISRPSLGSNVTSRTSISSNNGQMRSSISSYKPNSNRLSTISTISSIRSDDDDSGAQLARARCRLSGILSSPIRASYPVSKYYMPTPKAVTPNAGSLRDKFSQSFCSPNMTRVVITGDSRMSPSRVPIRKSISAETLHFSSPARDRNATLTLLKFSTPSAAPSRRARQSFQTTFTNDREINFEERINDNAMRNTFNKKDAYALEPDTLRVGRYDRLSASSRASSTSTTSLNTLSPTGSTSSMSRRDISEVVRQMKQMRLNDTSSSTSSKVNTNRPATAVKAFPSIKAVQPMRATAVIPPSTNISVNEVKAPPAINKSNYGGSTVTSSTTGQRKFIPPVAASSPKINQSPARPTNQTTPSRSRYNVKSSGYGGSTQNLNTSFGTKPPLQSPNPKAVSSSAGAMKQPVVPKSLGTRLQFAAKTEVPRLGSKTAMPPPKIPTTAATGLRRPASGVSTMNKENASRQTGIKTGLSRPRQ